MKIGDKVFYIQRDYDWWVDNGWVVDKGEYTLSGVLINGANVSIIIESDECVKYCSIEEIFLDLETAKTVCKARNEVINANLQKL